MVPSRAYEDMVCPPAPRLRTVPLPAPTPLKMGFGARALRVKASRSTDCPAQLFRARLMRWDRRASLRLRVRSLPHMSPALADALPASPRPSPVVALAAPTFVLSGGSLSADLDALLDAPTTSPPFAALTLHFPALHTSVRVRAQRAGAVTLRDVLRAVRDVLDAHRFTDRLCVHMHWLAGDEFQVSLRI